MEHLKVASNSYLMISSEEVISKLRDKVWVETSEVFAEFQASED